MAGSKVEAISRLIRQTDHSGYPDLHNLQSQVTPARHCAHVSIRLLFLQLSLQIPHPEEALEHTIRKTKRQYRNDPGTPRKPASIDLCQRSRL